MKAERIKMWAIAGKWTDRYVYYEAYYSEAKAKEHKVWPREKIVAGYFTPVFRKSAKKKPAKKGACPINALIRKEARDCDKINRPAKKGAKR
jgi:hypothetical protein